MARLDKWMTVSNPAPKLHKTIQVASIHCKERQQYSIPITKSDGTKEAFEKQEQWGWQSFLERYISTKSRELQSQYWGPTNLEANCHCSHTKAVGCAMGSMGSPQSDTRQRSA